MGTGTGMGRVRGMTSREQEREALTQRLEELEKRLEGVRGRLERLRRGKR
jgi:predicted nuclease with TOPRIM domain